MAKTIEELCDELGIETYTKEKYELDRERLLKQFKERYNLNSPEEIDSALISGAIHDHSDIAEEWMSNEEASKHF